MEFNYQIEPHNSVNIIRFDGTLNDKNQATKLLSQIDELIESGSSNFVLCMEGFKYINSTGLNVLITILTKARKSKGEAIISCVPQKIRELLLITKLNTVFTVVRTNDDAINKLMQQ